MAAPPAQRWAPDQWWGEDGLNNCEGLPLAGNLPGEPTGYSREEDCFLALCRVVLRILFDVWHNGSPTYNSRVMGQPNNERWLLSFGQLLDRSLEPLGDPHTKFEREQRRHLKQKFVSTIHRLHAHHKIITFVNGADGPGEEGIGIDVWTDLETAEKAVTLVLSQVFHAYEPYIECSCHEEDGGRCSNSCDGPDMSETFECPRYDSDDSYCQVNGVWMDQCETVFLDVAPEGIIWPDVYCGVPRKAGKPNGARTKPRRTIAGV